MLSLPPLEVAETVVGGVFVGVSQRGVVVDRLDKGIDGSAVRHDVRSNVNQLRRQLADVMNAEQLLVRGGENEFEHASEVTDDLSTRALVIVRSPNQVRHPFLPAF